MNTRSRTPGEFCWINVLTPQPAEAREFFGSLLHWTYVDMPGMGHRIQVGGRDIGGIFDLNGPNTPAGTPPGVGVMVKVEDADAISARANELGGKGKPAFDIMTVGRMAELVDPNGAQLDIWQPRSNAGTDVDKSTHGAPSWFESMTTNTARAIDFYTALFGWTSQTAPMGDIEYTTFMLDTRMVAGMMGIMPEMGFMPAHWAMYCTVDNMDDAIRNAESLGATIHVPVQSIPDVGRFGGITSPQGVMFHVIEYLDSFTP